MGEGVWRKTPRDAARGEAKQFPWLKPFEATISEHKGRMIEIRDFVIANLQGKTSALPLSLAIWTMTWYSEALI
eukprot:4755475-Pyramimonas_sp.AAC.1